jgi:hypothetical protein
MAPNPTSSAFASSKGRAEQLNKPSVRSLVQNLIGRVRLWRDKLLSLPHARVVMIFVAGFAVGVICQSYGGAVRTTIASWSPYLGWLAPQSASYDRIRADLAAARQSLDRLGSDINRLEAQGANVPRRRADR